MKSTQPNVLIAVAAFSCLVVTLLQSLVVPAIPRFPELLGTSATTVSWLVTATLLVGASAIPIVGRLADLYSPKRLLIITMGLVFVGSVIAPMQALRGMVFDAANFHEPALLAAVATYGLKQVMAGSDFPYFQEEKYVRAFEYIRGAGLPEEVKAQILRSNAARVLGL